MNVAFDIDGVIFPIEDYQLQEGQKYFKDRKVVNPNGYGIKEVFDCTSKEEVKFWLKKTFDYNKNVVANEKMPELISNLRTKGNRVYIISSRAKANEDSTLGSIMRNLVEDALKRNNIVTDGIVYTSIDNMEEEKLEAIKKYNIHAMIEDKMSVLDHIKNDTQAICFSTRNNQDYEDAKVLRANDAYELEDILDNLTSEFNSKKIDVLNYKEIDKLSDDEKIQYFYELRKMYERLIDPYYLEHGEEGCKRVIGKMQKAFNFIYRPHVIHKEKMPTRGGIILAANHLHAFDPLLLMTASKMPYHLLAKDELHNNKVWDKLFTTMGSIFVDNSDPESRKKVKEEAIKTILNDSIMMMYPEGTRNKTDKRLLDFHMGTVGIAQVTGAPIYPFGLNADYRMFKNNLCVAIGDPMYVLPTDNLVKKNEELKDRIDSLLDEVEIYEKCKEFKLTYTEDSK